MLKNLSHPIRPAPLPPSKGWPLLILSWLIPGAGFFLLGHKTRALALFLLVQIPFAVGVALTGSVLLPVWSEGDLGANIVNSLTFFTQMGNLGLGGLWLLGSQGADWAALPARAQKALGFFKGDTPHPLYELASFYLMVSGGLNYFCVCNFYDRAMTIPEEQDEPKRA